MYRDFFSVLVCGARVIAEHHKHLAGKHKVPSSICGAKKKILPSSSSKELNTEMYLNIEMYLITT